MRTQNFDFCTPHFEGSDSLPELVTNLSRTVLSAHDSSRSLQRVFRTGELAEFSDFDTNPIWYLSTTPAESLAGEQYSYEQDAGVTLMSLEIIRPISRLSLLTTVRTTEVRTSLGGSSTRREGHESSGKHILSLHLRCPMSEGT